MDRRRTKRIALGCLRTALNDPKAEFRPRQWKSIKALLSRRRILLVERTGWGKSMVYFLATRLLRDQGRGLSLLISPLLSLMRNQLEAASRIGIRARTINSSNPDKWSRIERELDRGEVDLLLISPERLANSEFRANVLSGVAPRIGLFMVDEAHCISDWGHDFRPDYRRIVRVLDALPRNVPVLATTATANQRVVDDVRDQLGDDVNLIRGPLVRESLRLQNISMPNPAERMAWLVEHIPTLSGSGIVYTLTQRDSERVAEWMRQNGIEAQAYHSGIGSQKREDLEERLLTNQLKVLASTVALGMGFDKPDLGFVVHFQRPSSVVHYYQQIGRAGRAISEAFAVLLHGEEDDQIADFFIRNAFPPQVHVEEILETLEDAEEGLSVPQLLSLLNLKTRQISDALKFLSVEDPSPVFKLNRKWFATTTATDYEIDQKHVHDITLLRKKEQEEMQTYMRCGNCLMKFLADALDDPQSAACEKCANCLGEDLLSAHPDPNLVNDAAIFLKRSYQPIPPRKRWPNGEALPFYELSGSIKPELQAEVGRALSIWKDAGWGQMVASGKYQHGRFDDSLVKACVEMIEVWNPEPRPTWITCVPSLDHPELVPDFARRLAQSLKIPFSPCVEKVESNRPQKEMENSFTQAHNLDGVFEIDEDGLSDGPCILVDDMVDSRWTSTVVSALLRESGCDAVFPVALAMNSLR